MSLSSFWLLQMNLRSLLSNLRCHTAKIYHQLRSSACKLVLMALLLNHLTN